jgi:hypothetical protein
VLLRWAGAWGGKGNDVYDLCGAGHPWMSLQDVIAQCAVGGTDL